MPVRGLMDVLHDLRCLLARLRESLVHCLVIKEFRLSKPMSNFCARLFGIARSMNEIGDTDIVYVSVTKTHMRIISANRARKRGFWFCRTCHFAYERYRFDTFKHKGNDRAQFHHVECYVKRFLSATCDHLA